MKPKNYEEIVDISKGFGAFADAKFDITKLDSTTMRFGKTEPRNRAGPLINGKMYKLGITAEDGTVTDFIGDANFWRDQFSLFCSRIDEWEAEP